MNIKIYNMIILYQKKIYKKKKKIKYKYMNSLNNKLY